MILLLADRHSLRVTVELWTLSVVEKAAGLAQLLSLYVNRHSYVEGQSVSVGEGLRGTARPGLASDRFWIIILSTQH